MCFLLSLKGFLSFAVLMGVTAGFTIGYCCYCDNDFPESLDEIVLVGIGCALCGFLITTVMYLGQFVGEMHKLHLSTEGLLPSENIVMVSQHIVVHLRNSRPNRFWEAVGGKLVLTDYRLLFLAYRGQFWHYRLSLSLEKIVQVDESKVLGMNGGLRVMMRGQKQELFTFGAVRDLDANLWAAAILRARYRLDPTCGTRDSS